MDNIILEKYQNRTRSIEESRDIFKNILLEMNKNDNFVKNNVIYQLGQYKVDEHPSNFTIFPYREKSELIIKINKPELLCDLIINDLKLAIKKYCWNIVEINPLNFNEQIISNEKIQLEACRYVKDLKSIRITLNFQFNLKCKQYDGSSHSNSYYQKYNFYVLKSNHNFSKNTLKHEFPVIILNDSQINLITTAKILQLQDIENYKNSKTKETLPDFTYSMCGFMNDKSDIIFRDETDEEGQYYLYDYNFDHRKFVKLYNIPFKGTI